MGPFFIAQVYLVAKMLMIVTIVRFVGLVITLFRELISTNLQGLIVVIIMGI